MCIYKTVLCIECGATELVQNLCRILNPLVALSRRSTRLSQGLCRGGICTICTSLLAISEFHFEDKRQHPEPYLRSSERERERSCLNGETSERQIKELGLPFRPFDEEPFEESQEDVALADLIFDGSVRVI